MKTFVFRNQTVETFLGDNGMTYSGYGDISQVPADVDRYIWFYQVPPGVDAALLAQEINSYTDQLDLVMDAAGASKPFIIFSLVNLFPVKLTGSEHGVDDAITDFNRRAVQLAAQRPNVKWVDFGQFVSRYDSETLVDWKYYLMSQTLLNPKLKRDFRQWWQRIEEEMELRRKKCLVLDLDNTLWGGVLGEDGVDGIQLGGDYPGKAYTYWQQALLQLSRSGVILTLCSKNNETDVHEAWDKNPFMVLKREHFSAMRINWNDKASNIQALADELNIGLDSMVSLMITRRSASWSSRCCRRSRCPIFPRSPISSCPSSSNSWRNISASTR